MRRYLISVFFLFGVALPAYAYLPLSVTQESLSDITHVKNPETTQVYYGEMKSFPHTYQIVSKRPFELYVEIQVPDIDSSTNNISGIIIKERETRGVREVARLKAGTADWEWVHEPVSNDWYRMGPQYEADVGPGVYRIEVNTPENIEKYVLRIGRKDPVTDMGYFEKVTNIAKVKVFFEKSQFRVVESKLVYVPLVTVAVLFVLVAAFRRRKRGEDGVV